MVAKKILCSDNRHLAEWRLSLLSVTVTVIPWIWNVKVMGICLPPFGRRANRLPLLGFHAGVPPARLDIIIPYLAGKVNEKPPLDKLGAGGYNEYRKGAAGRRFRPS